MPATNYNSEEIVRLGQQYYERDLRARVEPQHQGKFLALDIETGDYEIADQVLEAVRPLRVRQPQAVVYIHRIGHPGAYRLGRAFRTPAS